MKTLLAAIIFLTAIGCKDKRENSAGKTVFENFNFSYNDTWSTAFSIKFTNSDTAFIKQHWAPMNSPTLKSNTTYYSLLSNTDKVKLDSFVSHTNFLKLKTAYYRGHVEDALTYEFYIITDSIRKRIIVDVDTAPAELVSFANWIRDTKKNLILNQIDTTINFESAEIIPPPVATRIKFTPPKIK